MAKKNVTRTTKQKTKKTSKEEGGSSVVIDFPAGVNPIFAQMISQGKAVRIDLGCGERKQPGWVGVDMRDAAGVDIVQHLEQFPWKEIPDNVATTIMASHLIEHINPAGGIFLRFMDECWRIMKEGGQFMISLPYAGSVGYWQDPTHCNGCNEITWAYFDPLAKDQASGQFYHLYSIYRPKPWKIAHCSWSLQGFMEVILEKRAIDPSYNTSEEYTKPNK